MFTHRFAHAVGNLHALAAPARLLREREQPVPIARARVEEHGTSQMRDPEGGEIGQPAVQPAGAAAVEHVDVEPVGNACGIVVVPEIRHDTQFISLSWLFAKEGHGIVSNYLFPDPALLTTEHLDRCAPCPRGRRFIRPECFWIHW